MTERGRRRALPFSDLIRTARRDYTACAARILPPFVVAFVLLRLPLLGIDDSALANIVAQIVVPVVVGSLLTAAATIVFRSNRDAGRPAGVRDLNWVHLLGASAIAVALVLFGTIIMGPIGLLVQPALLGPPFLMHAILLEGRPLDDAGKRAFSLIRRDARLPLYLLLIALTLGLVVTVLLGVVAVVTNNFEESTQDVVFVVAQGALMGLVVPFVVAIGLRSYEDLAAETR
jgi:hypothetical protein